MKLLDPEAAISFGKREIELRAKLRASLSPLGGIPGIPELLDRRRHTCGIHDDAFKVQASFDVCFVHQIRWHEAETYGDGPIIMTENAKTKDREQTPRGVLVSAGLSALDSLRSNGIDLGHVVSFIRQAPWRMPAAMLDGVELPLLILRAGDITGSEDLREAIVKGEARVEWNEELMQHFYVDQQGKRWTPKTPFLPADY